MNTAIINRYIHDNKRRRLEQLQAQERERRIDQERKEADERN